MANQSESTSAGHKRRLRPKVYSAAIYIVGIFILAQIIALISVFWLRKTVVKLEVVGPEFKAHEDASWTKLSSGREAAKLPPLDNLPAPHVSGRLSVPHPEGNEERILKLNDQAREFRRQGEFTLAEMALKKALDLDPAYPNTLINYAMLEEARGNQSMALDYWQRLISLGEKAGAALRLARERAMILEDNLSREKIARERESMIIQSSRKLLVDKIRFTPSSFGTKPSKLQVEFKIRSLIKNLSPGKMRVQVFFYERLSNGDLIPAKIKAKFLKERPDWQDGLETLIVRYSRAAQQRSEKRNFYGYLIRIIYDGEVQDERAMPSDLLKIFPYQSE